MKHARLSASSAHRWLNCAGSIPPADGPRDASIYAATGTFAHDIGAKCLEKMEDPAPHLGAKGKVDGYDIECDQEMVDGVRVYVDAIREDMQTGDYTWVEMPLLAPLSEIDPDLGGTADFVRYRPAAKHLRVFDFKYGSGTYVEADSNEQMMLYALGAMLRVGQPVDDVEVTVVQPRFEGAAPVRSWSFKAHEILDFIADVKDAAERTRQPEPSLAAGDWCKFCKMAKTCKELERQQHALMAAEFGEMAETDKLAVALASIPLVKERIRALEEAAYKLAVAGTEIPGFKLVDKVARRQWKSEADAAEFATAKGIDPYEKSIISPAQLETKLKEMMPKGKKKEAAALLEPLVEKVSSGTALVPVDDKRPSAKRVTALDFPVIEGAAGGSTVAALFN